MPPTGSLTDEEIGLLRAWVSIQYLSSAPTSWKPHPDHSIALAAVITMFAGAPQLRLRGGSRPVRIC